MYYVKRFNEVLALALPEAVKSTICCACTGDPGEPAVHLEGLGTGEPMCGFQPVAEGRRARSTRGRRRSASHPNGRAESPRGGDSPY